MRVVALLTMLLTASLAAAEQAVLESFDYPDETAARAAWPPAEDSLPVGLMPHGDGTALKLNADFTTASRRAVYDRQVDWDLSQWGRFTLDVYIDDPGLIGNFSLYLRAEGGWYAFSFSPGRRGWQTIAISRAAFRTEDKPIGFEKIVGLRLSGWRGAERAGFVAVDNFVGYREDKVLIYPSHTIDKGGDEAHGVAQYGETIAGLLGELGVRLGTVTDAEVERGGLKGRKLAIFAYNPDISEAEAAATAEFVAGGGKIMVFYSAPPAIRRLLGLQGGEYARDEPRGRFSTIRFDAQDIDGLPEQVGQRSWNINAPVPAADGARVIARWYDQNGQDTGLAALSLSDAGMFMSHVLLPDDAAGKQRLLLAIIGKLCPEVWSQVTARALEGPSRIGTIDGRAALVDWLNSRPLPDRVKAALTAEAEARALAVKRREEGRHADSLAAATEADRRLREAYLLALPSRPAEFRAVWNHSGTGAHATWDESMRNLRDNGLNAVLPNVVWGGVALYDSEYLPHAKIVAEQGDQLAAAVAAGRKYGVEVHPWKVNWNLGHQVSQEFRDKLAAEDRLLVDVKGKVGAWLEPSDPRNQDLEVNVMVEMARKYDVDGVHFDYIRYPGSDQGYSEAARQRFQQATGVQVANWPADVRQPEIYAKWLQWRCDNISTVVRRTAEEVRRIKPDCRISAAVFSSYPNCREQVSQDWVHWIKQGWLDIVCPMDYTNSDAAFASTVTRQLAYIGNRIPICPGIGASSSSSSLAPDRVAGQIDIARRVGADGFVIFNYGPGLASEVLPSLKLGPLATDAATGLLGPVYRFDAGELKTDRLFGRHAQPGETVQAVIRREPDPAGLKLTGVKAGLVLEDAIGLESKDLGAAPAPGEMRTIQVKPEAGLWRLVVRGEVTVQGRRRPFSARGPLMIVGPCPPDLAEML